jgi:HSP20 family protein
MWQEMDEMRGELEHMLRRTSMSGNFLSPGGLTDRMLPAIRGEFRVDIREDANEVIVIADLPGVEKDEVSLQLINPRALEISTSRNEELDRESREYYVKERVAGSMQRIVSLPTEVQEEGAMESFKNGVHEVRMKMIKAPRKSRIEIE